MNLWDPSVNSYFLSGKTWFLLLTDQIPNKFIFLFFFQITQCFEKILLSKSRSLSDDKLQNQSNLQVKCLANFILENLNKKAKIISPETEIECTEIWCNGKKCDCAWHPESNRNTRNIKLRNKRNEGLQDVSRRLFSLKTDESKTADIWEMRSNKNESIDDELLIEDDIYYTDNEENSEDEVFYTPPESPTSFIELSSSSLDESDESLKNYHHYILG